MNILLITVLVLDALDVTPFTMADTAEIANTLMIVSVNMTNTFSASRTDGSVGSDDINAIGIRSLR